jgi:UDP-N-acetyl-D-galactosamine dehydrogenase
MQHVIAVVGLGYVGLPLAHRFAEKGYRVIGYDISTARIESLQKGHDWTNELTEKQLKAVSLELSSDPKILRDADIVIVALPTPVDESNKPDITILKDGSRAVGSNLKKGAIIVFESTVWPGTTEEICGPILEEASGLVSGKDFFLGYSPERINPGDKEHTVSKIKKVVSGQDEKTADILCEVYGAIIDAGVHRAPNIKVAEMAKAIENAQRDLNIAFVNEIALLSERVGIRTTDVLEAASTKWNFLKFTPGLVGGHCIGVDPYYLVEKAKQLGMETHVITAGRKINDGMGAEVARQIVEALPADCREPHILVLGLTFKENVPDTRNSKSTDVIRALEKSGCIVSAHDPYLTDAEMQKRKLIPGALSEKTYDAVVLLVPHKEYVESNGKAVIAAARANGLVYDLKSVLSPEAIEKGGRKYRSL